MTNIASTVHTFGQLNPEEIANLVEASADISLTLNSEGVIQSIAFGNPDLRSPNLENWVGKSWIDVVTVESRPKIQALLTDANESSLSRFRQINVAMPGASDLPLLCATLKIGSTGQIIALARDLREISLLQQRLVDAQQAIERDYTRLRQLETRYRVLFEMASEAVLVLDANTFKIVEANPRAADLLNESIKKLNGRSLIDYLAKGDRIQAQSLLSKVAYTSTAADLSTQLLNGQEAFLSAAPFRNENQSLLLITIKRSGEFVDRQDAGAQSLVIQALENAPDGFIVTNSAGKILTANQAFLRLIMADKLDQILNEPLERWLERSSVDLRVMLSNLQEKGSIKLFATSIRDSFGTLHPVEISAVSVAYPHACLGFTIREVGSRIRSKIQPEESITRSSEELTQLVGRLPLKEIINETTDLIEQLCIKAALELTRGNRVSASEMLGLSRQSLYIKLRKYNLSDQSKDSDIEE
ncbi:MULTISPECIES: transcriptional regulator PpsR [unclassified Polynucleobacter]|uniref:transcriptional regulator PpsR n=1 Tax=unclassified Polynucleobacter TaxID=2640945 RepID=UPI002573982E|nr:MULTISPECIES: transcriptional regulator PpsR [unclassified Polynucleobacter]BEI43122.1 transcriptional regulator PpsR [Polynucleobacter sp. HIN10]BEI44899.1 transcriptional regulator PpsR [Polynucleobacter sp. HIN11]